MRNPRHLYSRSAIVAVLLLYAASVFAHDGVHTGVMGFAEGFAHPFSGLDHMLAMLGIGLWAAQNQRSAVWVLPLAFPLMMVLGAVLATLGMSMSIAELGIASSVAVLGLLIAFAVRMPVWGAAMLVSLFGMFHGYSHGVEMPKGASAAMFGVGFVLATLALHLAGVAIGLLATHPRALSLVRLGGAGIAAVGVYLLAA